MGKRLKQPKCPNCGAELERVFETNHLTYLWDAKKGRYEEQDGDLEMQCPECDFDLYEVFPDGVCNYRIGKAKKEDLSRRERTLLELFVTQIRSYFSDPDRVRACLDNWITVYGFQPLDANPASG